MREALDQMYIIRVTFVDEISKGGKAEIRRRSVTAAGVQGTKGALRESQRLLVPCPTVLESRGGSKEPGDGQHVEELDRQQQPCSGPSTWGRAVKMGMPSSGVEHSLHSVARVEGKASRWTVHWSKHPEE
ncbi:unnamed protein product [Calypogeia fissa]